MKLLYFQIFGILLCITGFSQTYQVGHTTINFTDSTRSNRIIQTEVYYPANMAGTDVSIAGGQFPVIIFGHGFVMVWSAYQNLWDNFVPLGYIMAFPRTEGNISPNHGEFGKDLKFLAGAMQNEGITSSSIFFNAVKDKTAIMGHSMGGGSAILSAASNTAIETVVAFSPAETNPSAIASAENITVDALILAGAQDGVAPPSANAIPIYDTLGSSCKTYISISGGAHCYFANSNFNCDFGEGSSSSGISITRAEQQDITNDFVNLWLDYKLKGNCNALDVFNDSLTTSPRITRQQNCIANPVPTISNNNGILQSSAGIAYQWYSNSNLIPGATSQQYSPVITGNYSVEVSYSNGCMATSLPFPITIVGSKDEVHSNEFELYPNPAEKQITIFTGKVFHVNVKISIINKLGQIVKEFTENASPENFIKVIDIADLSSGIYFVILESDNFYNSAYFIK